MLNISVIGTGYVGLVAGVCFAESGHQVTCIDHDTLKIDKLKSGVSPIYEPGLEEMLARGIEAGKLHFDTSLVGHINESDVIIIAVGTPTDEKTQRINLAYVDSVVNEIIGNISKDTVIIIKSTVTSGTCDSISKKLNESTEYSCKVVSNPEFLREGSAVNDFMSPDRIIIGCDPESIGIMDALYSNHIKRGILVIYTNRITAELTKYAANAFLAMKIGFINEIASLSEKVGANIADLERGIGSDPRIGDKFLNPGPGFGGSCFPKDVIEITNITNDVNSNNTLIQAINKSNDDRIKELVSNILKMVSMGEIISILGVTYKAGTDDTRASPAIRIIEALINEKYKVKCYDPTGLASAKKILGDKVIYSENLYDAVKDSSLVVIATEWQEFKSIDAMRVKNLMKTPAIYDLRNIIDRQEFQRNGFNVKSIGY